MTSINAIDFYTKIREELIKLDELINYLENNNVNNEEQNILIGFLNSIYVAEGSFHRYSIKKLSSLSNENLKSDYIKKFKNFKKDFNFVDFLNLTTIIRSNIENIFKEYNYFDNNIIELLEELNKISRLYQNIVQNNEEKKDIVIFFAFVKNCVIKYRSVLKSINSFNDVLICKHNITEENDAKVLELQLLDTEYNLGEFAEILQNINNAYTNLSRLFPNVKYTNLKIIKVESGSLLSRILGDDKIIEVITLFLSKISDYIHYNWTRNGKLELNSKIMKDIEEDAKIINELESLGINTEESKQNIKDTLNAATKDLYNVVSKAPKMKINDNTINMIDPTAFLEYNQKYLETKKENEKEN